MAFSGVVFRMYMHVYGVRICPYMHVCTYLHVFSVRKVVRHIDTGRTHFFLKLSKKMKSKKMRFLRKWFSKKMVSLSKKMDLGDFLPRSGTVTELSSRRTCVRSFFFVAT